MIVGIPNVGKSTFINSFTGRKSAKTGNKPGVTKGKQWIRINGSVELLDTPGILWPKIEDRNVGERLAMIGSINDQILNIEELALETIKFLRKNYQPQLYSRYDITEDIFDNVDTETMMNPENAAALCIMEHIARKDALSYLKNIIKDPFHIQHALTVEAVMKWYASELGYGEDAEYWGIVGSSMTLT